MAAARGSKIAAAVRSAWRLGLLADRGRARHGGAARASRRDEGVPGVVESAIGFASVEGRLGEACRLPMAMRFRWHQACRRRCSGVRRGGDGLGFEQQRRGRGSMLRFAVSIVAPKYEMHGEAGWLLRCGAEAAARRGQRAAGSATPARGRWRRRSQVACSVRHAVECAQRRVRRVASSLEVVRQAALMTAAAGGDLEARDARRGRCCVIGRSVGHSRAKALQERCDGNGLILRRAATKLARRASRVKWLCGRHARMEASHGVAQTGDDARK
jgi:hypothetical protein